MWFGKLTSPMALDRCRLFLAVAVAGGVAALISGNLRFVALVLASTLHGRVGNVFANPNVAERAWIFSMLFVAVFLLMVNAFHQMTNVTSRSRYWRAGTPLVLGGFGVLIALCSADRAIEIGARHFGVMDVSPWSLASRVLHAFALWTALSSVLLLWISSVSCRGDRKLNS